MSLEPTVEDEQLIADTFRRSAVRPGARETLVGAVLGAGFFAFVATVWLLHPPGRFSAGAAALCVIVLALATCVRFDTPLGFTVPTQLAFVPLLFVVPLALVPIALAIAVALARFVDMVKGRLAPTRLLRVTGNCWFSIGPVLVFLAAGTEPRHAGAALLLAALGAQFAVDFAASSIESALERGASLASQLGDAWVYAVDAALSWVALIIAKRLHSAPADVLSVVPLLGLFSVFARERRQRLEGLIELGSAYRGTALVLGDVIEADDTYTGTHCKSVVALCLDVADRLGLTGAQRRNLEFGALLHDVGKIAIPKEIIHKPGKLDPEEWTVVKTHTLEGQKMLERVGGFMRQVAAIVRSHHERWDGQGYPDALKGEQIPLEARIIACCDTWHAMRTDRPYRRALDFDTAVDELRSVTGSQLDPRIVAHLLVLIDEGAVDEASAPRGVAPAEADAGAAAMAVT